MAKKVIKKPAAKKKATKAKLKTAKKAQTTKSNKKKAVVKKKTTTPAKKTTKKVVKKVVKKLAKPAKKVVKKATKSTTKKTGPATKFVAHTTHLKPGDIAPHFEGKDQNGNTISKHDFAGKTIILYFYPKDDTPGCTATACSLRDEYQFLTNSNYAVIGVSADDEKSHAKFAKKFSLPFPLIADTEKSIMKSYNVWGTKQFMGRIFDGVIRTTFVINNNGIIDQVIKSVDTANHAQQILEAE